MYNNYVATYDELLALDNKMNAQQRHLQFLAIEIYKSKNKLNPSFMWKTYKEKNIPYLQRRGTSRSIPNVNTQIYDKFIKFQRKCFVEQPINKV